MHTEKYLCYAMSDVETRLTLRLGSVLFEYY